MRIVIGLFIILSNEALNSGNATKKHVHFKIHVPEIIKHQIHTKTVFVHIHKPGSSIPKKSKLEEEAPKKSYHKKTHQEEWSSWSTYGSHDHDDKSGNNLSKDHNGIKKEEAHKHKENSFHQYPEDSYMPLLQHNDKPDYPRGKQEGDMMGYSYPPRYAVHENIKETDHNDIEPYVQVYEEGYQKGGEYAHGHVYTGDVTKFYEGKHEEGDHSIDEESKNESTEKTHTGRYFIDDNEYQRDSDKPEKRAYFVLS